MNLGPLLGLRLQTPRLELRLPTEGEVDDLYEAAARGIHRPEVMPFGVAWTDSLEREGFHEFHRATLASWEPGSWNLNLVTFLDGVPIGSQGLRRRNAARELGTGSWIEKAQQGRGFGLEQRAAVVELASAASPRWP